MFGIDPRAAEIAAEIAANRKRAAEEAANREAVGLLSLPPIHGPQPTGILSALQGVTLTPEMKNLNYYNTNVADEELGEFDRKRLYVPETNKYKAYQVGKEERLTVGEGVYLDDNALKYLGLKRKDVVEGTEIDADLVNKLGSKRWNQAVKNSKEILGDTNSSVGAFAEMIYQMGLPSAKGFEDTIKLFKKMGENPTREQIEEARKEALDSDWYREDSPERAKRVVSRIGQSKL